jgi:hypothetical protein
VTDATLDGVAMSKVRLNRPLRERDPDDGVEWLTNAQMKAASPQFSDEAYARSALARLSASNPAIVSNALHDLMSVGY